MMNEEQKELVYAGIFGFVVGDALGVPVEFESREELKQHPVSGMTGYGTHHQPPGTWSDDSSLMFCLMETFVAGFDLRKLGNRFVNWLDIGYWTPFGKAFDVGIGTRKAIDRLRDTSIHPKEAGGAGEKDNGNGASMRILPLCFALQNKSLEERVSFVSDVSSLTHKHPRSLIGSTFLIELGIAILQGKTIPESIQIAQDHTKIIFRDEKELSHYKRLLLDPKEIQNLSAEEIHSSGYVVHTLEACVWTLLQTNSFREAALMAVNLGDDTDTVGAITGGLAGMFYGQNQIPKEWIDVLARKEDILALVDSFQKILASQ